jgi:hypothetical protein
MPICVKCRKACRVRIYYDGYHPGWTVPWCDDCAQRDVKKYGAKLPKSKTPVRVGDNCVLV